MGELVFVGLGLFDHHDISVHGLNEVKEADFVFAEFYTNLMAGLSLDSFEEEVGKRVTVVSRKMLEDENGEQVLQKAEGGRVAFLVPGDPLIATTHVDLRIRAERRGIRTRLIHGASIISAVIGLSGLQNYRFGRSVTIPFPEGGSFSETPYTVIAENKARNLHTLCFLDIQAEKKRYMTINETLKLLLGLEEKRKRRIVTLDTLAVGAARVGAVDASVRAEKVRHLIRFDFGGPPHVLVMPSEKLHFMEAEALITFTQGPEWVREMAQ